MKSAKRNSTEGTLDRLVGRLMEKVGKATGNTRTRATGKAARGRGTSRRQMAKGRGKTGR